MSSFTDKPLLITGGAGSFGDPLTEFNFNNTELLDGEAVRQKPCSLTYICKESEAWEANT